MKDVVCGDGLKNRLEIRFKRYIVELYSSLSCEERDFVSKTSCLQSKK